MRKDILTKAFALAMCMMCAMSAVAQQAYVEYTCTAADTTLTFYCDGLIETRSGVTFDLNTGDNAPGWYADRIPLSITQVVFDPTFANARPTTMFRWFSSMHKVDSITGLNYLNTTLVTNMGYAFDQCFTLDCLDLSNFNTANVTNMTYLFNDCHQLKSIDLSHFNTANVTDMSWMFCNCINFKSIDLSFFDTSQVTNMTGMFNGCNILKSLDLSSFDTRNVESMNCMFSLCGAITSINLSSFNTSHVTDMFGMFQGCFSLTSLDLRPFNTINVKYMEAMFRACYELTTIYAGRGWSNNAVINSETMFSDCINIKGGKGTTYDANYTDATYAHIDGGRTNPGYFTEAPTPIVGDVNGDGYVNITDVTTLTDLLIIGTEGPTSSDVNGDGRVSIEDVTALIDLLLNGSTSIQ